MQYFSSFKPAARKDLRVESDVAVYHLTSFEDSLPIVSLLCQRKAAIANLERLPAHQAQRVVDILAGTTCAIDGETHWIGGSTFLFAPQSVTVKTSRPMRPSASHRLAS